MLRFAHSRFWRVAEICAKRVELIKEAVPGTTRLGVLVNPANPSGEMALTAMARAAGSLQVELLPVKVIKTDDWGLPNPRATAPFSYYNI